MRTLNIHAISFSYTTTKPAIKNPPDPPSSYNIENALIVFVSIEKGDSQKTVYQAAGDIIAHAKTVGVNKIVIYPYAHLSSNLANPTQAFNILSMLEKRLIEKRMNVHRAPFGWYKKFTLHAAGHPLSELSRTFKEEEKPYLKIGKKMEKLKEDYLKRFGFEIAPEKIIIKEPWSLLSLLPFSNGRKICYSKELIQDDDCGIICTVINIKPEKIFFWDCLDRELSDAINYMKNMKITYDKKIIKAAYRDYEAVIGMETSDGRKLFKNSMLITLIADRIIDVNKGVTPVLPIKYSPIQLAVITKGEVDKPYIERVYSIVQKTGLQRTVVDDDAGKRLGEKIRKYGKLWTPIVIIIGPREEKTESVIIRFRKKNEQYMVGVNELEKELKNIIGGEDF
jgi:threonyl-tRNA synthetase